MVIFGIYDTSSADVGYVWKDEGKIQDYEDFKVTDWFEF